MADPKKYEGEQFWQAQGTRNVGSWGHDPESENFVQITGSEFTFMANLMQHSSFQDNLVKLVPECQILVDFAAARDVLGGGGANWNF